ncbi:hypothetical protein Pyn_39282 [Prunus yedoensis var. nudiflora]|uniref:Uncharacterized protein n=1 Tax=Prunus yedoensis var. nudiflora TaxID=2094558 RepID=A0A314YFK9_PRUYE|nr:hypothetical protein Pyn_39282 [Prunus yedoensis var. nudiflora]
MDLEQQLIGLVSYLVLIVRLILFWMFDRVLGWGGLGVDRGRGGLWRVNEGWMGDGERGLLELGNFFELGLFRTHTEINFNDLFWEPFMGVHRFLLRLIHLLHIYPDGPLGSVGYNKEKKACPSHQISSKQPQYFI